MSVVPAMREAEAGEILNLGGGDCGELRSHYCIPAWETRVKLCFKRKKKKKVDIEKKTYREKKAQPQSPHTVILRERRHCFSERNKTLYKRNNNEKEHLKIKIGSLKLKKIQWQQ